MTISLRAVDGSNLDDIVDLDVAKEQEDFVASNVYSIAESKYNLSCRPRAIYFDESPVGFAMYEDMASEGKPEEFDIFRFMIDEQQQRKGFGKLAFKAILDEIKSLPEAKVVTICYMPENKVAQTMYRGFGFEEYGFDEEEGEILARLIL